MVVFSNYGEQEVGSSTVSGKHFGVNFLFTKDGEISNFADVVNDISDDQVPSVRYPGGEMTERFFDPTDPLHFDPSISLINATSISTGETKKVISTLSFLKQAAESNWEVTIVLPTKRYVDDAGNINPNAHSEIKVFVLKVLETAAELGVEVSGFELGNEWYVAAPDLSDDINFSLEAIEYGEVAGVIAVATQDAIFESGLFIDIEEPFIALQAATDWSPYWVATEELEGIADGVSGVDGALEAIDAMVSHWYLYLNPETPSKWDYYDAFGAEDAEYVPWDISLKDRGVFAQFDILEHLLAKPNDTLERIVTEWNVDAQGQFYEQFGGVLQWDPVITMFNELISEGVDQANFWAVTQSRYNSLAGASGVDNTPIRELFDLMSDQLVGAKAVDLNGSGRGLALTLGDPYDLNDDIRVNGFRSESEDILYFSSRSDTVQSIAIDFSAYSDRTYIEVVRMSVNETDRLLPLSEQSVEVQTITYGLDTFVGAGTNFVFQPYEFVSFTLLTSDGPGSSKYADDINGSNGDDLIRGDDGDDTLFGAAGNDVLAGNYDKDRLSGGMGNDELFGGADNDSLNGDEGEDFVDGGYGRDSVRGGDGDDLLFGRAGADKIAGNYGDDRLFGGGQNDLLFGGEGDDELNGGSNDDRLSGGIGSDSLTGNSGADTFVFETSAGTDTVQDFEDGTDMIQYQGGAFADLTIVAAGGNIDITGANGGHMILLNTDLAQITVDDFVL